ncbi:capsular polysaccharide synthesis protein [Novosphingobium colocasiae]|uniref:capsular polysaccharide synthesis protein n=1 Tax=Novosphingobium colocasiae TaxID=1256513 RepID=UPI0035B49A41
MSDLTIPPAPAPGGTIKRRNPLSRLALRAFFQVHYVWCAVRRKLTDRTQRPRSLGRAMLLAPPMTSRTVWIYWDRGWDAMPPLARLSYDSWRQRNPGWEVRLLDQETALTLTGIPAEVSAKRMKPSQLADLIRLELLTRFGGVWVDATTFCQVPLDQWLAPAMPFGFFAFTVTEQRTVATWFLASAQDNPIMRAWRDVAFSFWSCASSPTTYLMFYDFFSLALARFPEAGRMWRYSSHLERTQENILRYEYLTKDLAPAFAQALERGLIPLHKFSFREAIPDSFAGTPLALILECDTREAMEQRAAMVAR